MLTDIEQETSINVAVKRLLPLGKRMRLKSGMIFFPGINNLNQVSS